MAGSALFYFHARTSKHFVMIYQSNLGDPLEVQCSGKSSLK
jgi:hypothetical protein